MPFDVNIPLAEMVFCMANAVDLVSPAVSGHHNRVSYIASAIAAEFGLSEKEQFEIMMAGALHDTGALNLRERLDALKFEVEAPHHHAELGYRHLRTFLPLMNVAKIVRFHHVEWRNGEGRNFRGMEVPIESHILQLADRVDAAISRNRDIMSQVDEVIRRISSQSGEMFRPDVVRAFLSVSRNGCFWEGAANCNICEMAKNGAHGSSVRLDVDGLYGVARLFSHIIDFRSRFTSIHSSGVASCAYMLAGTLGMSGDDCTRITISGLLHDLGKLAVPAEILDKKGPLNYMERKVINAHPRHTYETLKNITRFETINSWASHHHERLDGRGYPFRLAGDELDLGSRIVAVSDIFTALKEDRPYRTGMDSERVLGILDVMADDGALDHDVVEIVHKYHDQLDLMRIKAQDDARRAFKEFWMNDI